MFAIYLPAVSLTGISSGISSVSAMRCSAAASVEGKFSLKCCMSSAANFPSATPNNSPFCALTFGSSLGVALGLVLSLVLGVALGVALGLA